MAASTNDKLTDTFNSANPNVARVTAGRTAGATTLVCDNLAGWPTVSKVHFSTYQLNTANAVVAGTQIDWSGIVSGNSIGSLVRLAGATDAGNSINDVVEMNPTASWAHDLFTWGGAEHNQLDGTHKAITATSLAATGNISSSAGKITTTVVGKLEDAAIPLTTYRSENAFDYVASGMVWSGDSYGASLNASMTSGVVYINGRRIAMSAVTARPFTLNVDTYIDVLDNADGTGTLVYTTAATNAASPALAANSLRIGIIQAAASITAATKVNQGQEDRVFPIASSIAYSVTDSLGNLICPRDPSRRLLGYRQIVTTFATSSATAVQVTGLSCPVIAPTGRKVKVSAFTYSHGAAGVTDLTLWDGIVASGTQIQQQNNTTGQTPFGYLEAIVTPSAASKTYNVGLASASGSDTLGATSSNPAWVKVELY